MSDEDDHTEVKWSWNGSPEKVYLSDSTAKRCSAEILATHEAKVFLHRVDYPSNAFLRKNSTDGTLVIKLSLIKDCSDEPKRLLASSVLFFCFQDHWTSGARAASPMEQLIFCINSRIKGYDRNWFFPNEILWFVFSQGFIFRHWKQCIAKQFSLSHVEN